MRKLALLAAVSAMSAQAAQAQEIDTFTPASVWAADYGNDYCRLLRDFSHGDDRVSLMFERTHPSAAVRVILIGDAVRPFRNADRIGYRWLPSGGERYGQKIVGSASNGVQTLNLGPVMLTETPGPGAFVPGKPAYSREDERQAAAGMTGLLLEGGLYKPIRLETGSLGPVIEAMQACTDDMLRLWNLDPEADATLTRTVVPGDGTAAPPEPGQIPQSPAAGWISQETIPFNQFANLAGGANQVRILVDANGKATGCSVLLPVLSAETNASICEQVMANAMFQPALDARGQAIDSYWATGPMALMPPMRGGGGRGRR